MLPEVMEEPNDIFCCVGVDPKVAEVLSPGDEKEGTCCVDWLLCPGRLKPAMIPETKFKEND